MEFFANERPSLDVLARFSARTDCCRSSRLSCEKIEPLPFLPGMRSPRFREATDEKGISVLELDGYRLM